MRRIVRLLAALAALAAIAGPVHALAARRALVIGIASYANVDSLEKPTIDADAMAAKLGDAGFLVTVVRNPKTRRDLVNAFDVFTQSVQPDDDVFIFYSGHGVDVDGQNMLVPADSPSPQETGQLGLRDSLLLIRPIMQVIEDRQARNQIWFIDACRNNPYASKGRAYGQEGGLTRPDTDLTNSFLLFSANYGQVAKDKLPGDLKTTPSPFTRTVADLFDNYKDKPIEEFSKEIRKRVLALVSPYVQFPIWENGIVDQWCFDNCTSGVESVSIATIKKTSPVAARSTIVNSDPASSAQLQQLSQQGPVAFIGKLSGAGCAVNTVSDARPFGCATLKQVIRYFGTGSAASPKGPPPTALVVETPVYLRQKLPATGGNGTSYGCRVRVLAKGNRLQARSVVAFKYAGDTFYWAIVADGSTTCLNTNSPPDKPKAERK